MDDRSKRWMPPFSASVKLRALAAELPILRPWQPELLREGLLVEIAEEVRKCAEEAGKEWPTWASDTTPWPPLEQKV